MPAPDHTPTRTQPLTDNSRWALVTGASSGIGDTCCRQLAALGYHLVMVARRADRMHALAAELQKTHGTASLVIPADLSEPHAVAQIARRLEQEDLSIEFLVNNAGYGVPGRFNDADWETHARFLQVMVNAVCELTWYLLPAMQQRGKGYIVNVASVAGLLPGSEGHTLYAGSKAMLVRFSESLALENAKRGVNVSALCPGFTYSEFHDVTGTRTRVSQMPGFMWLDREDVVRYGIDSVTRAKPRIVAVTGWVYKLLVWMNGAVPGFGLWMTRRMSHRFRNLE
jgi:short-subunit dehydrogenase